MLRTLSLEEIRDIRLMAVPERLKQCGLAYSVSVTYIPVLCEMAEEYVKARAAAFGSGRRVRYSLIFDQVEGHGVEGSDGFRMFLGHGEGSREKCLKLMERFNRL